MTDEFDGDLEAFLDNIPGMPAQPRQQRVQPNNGEVDVTAQLMRRLQQQHGDMAPQVGPPADYNSRPQEQKVYLREGYDFYTLVPADMSNVSIAMKGTALANTNGKEFVFKGIRNFFLIEGHQAIDMSNIDQSQLRPMCVVEAPWVGTIVVPESAIIRPGNRGQQVLKG